MPFSGEIRRRIVLASEMIDEEGIREQAVSEGMLTLRGSAREVVKQGETSVVELIRVTAGEH
jgi:type IV pilus assembly protein PilB